MIRRIMILGATVMATATDVRAQGAEVWVYNPRGYCIDSTAMALRTKYWWIWQERIPAVFQWTITAWIEWTGSTTLWDPHRNASWIVPGDDGPLNTVRFELTREGMEDHEYLTMLDGLAARAEAVGRQVLAIKARRVLAQVGRIVSSPPSEKAAMRHTEDQRLLHRTRREIGDTIEEVARALGHTR